jgi:GNAT superfamily N-acetyltransferase
MSNLILRPATEADIPTILELIRELAEFEKEPESAVATPELMYDALFGAESVAHAVIAEDDGVGIGMAVYFFNFSTWTGRPGLHLEDLYVRPSHRGQGVARRLFAYLARVAIERGCGRLELAVLDWNVNAIRLYDGLGGVPMAGWTTYRFTPDTIAEIAGGGTAPILNR